MPILVLSGDFNSGLGTLAYRLSIGDINIHYNSEKRDLEVSGLSKISLTEVGAAGL